MAFLSQSLKICDKHLPIYIVGHERPDGDAIGSQIALAVYLNTLGYQAYAVVTEDTPEIFRTFLNNAPNKNVKDIDVEAKSYWIAVDCGKPSRIFESLRQCRFLLVIDHHPKEDKWAQFSCVEPAASSTCEILTFLLSQNGYRFNDTFINESLYLGLLTDSGNFSHNNVTQHTFECAEQLVRAGVEPCKIIQRIFNNRTQAQLKLQSLFLDHVEIYSQDAIVVSTLSFQDYADTNTNHNDTEGFVNQLLTLKNAKIAAFIEYNKTFVKGSLRSNQPNIPVNVVAKKWNGGGHICAAGFQCDLNNFSFKEFIHDLDSLLP